MRASDTAAVRRVVLAAPVEAVWRALTEAGSLSAWFGGRADLEPFPGGQLVVEEDGRLRRGVVVDLEPGRRLAVRWLPAAHRVGFLWGDDVEAAGTSGEIEFTLEPTPAGTRLTVVERPPVPAPAEPRPPALSKT